MGEDAGRDRFESRGARRGSIVRSLDASVQPDVVPASYARTMSSSRGTSSRRRRGEIATLPSGSLRVKVYAGIDPLSGKRHYLTETIPAGLTAAADAEKART